MRHNASKVYVATGLGQPVYKKGAYQHICRILGPLHTWIDKTPEEYFTDELKQAVHILSFSSTDSFKSVRTRYLKLSRGSYEDNCSGWHPDTGGHDRAFDILNHAYNIFKEAQ